MKSSKLKILGEQTRNSSDKERIKNECIEKSIRRRRIANELQRFGEDMDSEDSRDTLLSESEKFLRVCIIPAISKMHRTRQKQKD